MHLLSSFRASFILLLFIISCLYPAHPLTLVAKGGGNLWDAEHESST